MNPNIFRQKRGHEPLRATKSIIEVRDADKVADEPFRAMKTEGPDSDKFANKPLRATKIIVEEVRTLTKLPMNSSDLKDWKFDVVGFGHKYENLWFGELQGHKFNLVSKKFIV